MNIEVFLQVIPFTNFSHHCAQKGTGKKNYPISWRGIVPRWSSWSSSARW